MKVVVSAVALVVLLAAIAGIARAEDPYIFFTWNVTYDTISPLGVPQRAILINGQFPGPNINSTTNNNVVINVFNNLNEPFLLSWVIHTHTINITRTIKIVSHAGNFEGKKIYALNGISHVDTATPLKLLEYFGLAGKEFKYDLMKDEPAAADGGPITARAPNVLRAEHRTYIEIIIENAERSPNFFHLDGYSFFTVGMGGGTWSPDKRSGYNLLDAVSRHTIQVYPKSWTAIMTTFDNVGVWNFRSEIWERRYLGQQMYISVLNEARSVRDEYTMQNTTALCGAVVGLPTPAPYT
ncbi:L-ascorbate oxidase homolog [Asparagus officinalis]|uniref:L-ascorbate oxidase homolog n=1 Tax=Asparagus officinalis TaxID=4686 RepID=UPI00098E43E4|nr:L-ascorbate oxidase homolog [Asparagus officinalis]